MTEELMLESPVVQGVKKKFENARNRGRRNGSPGFNNLFLGFARGDPHETIALDLGIPVDSVRKYWKHWFKKLLNETRAKSVASAKSRVASNAQRRLFAMLPNDSAVRVVANRARTAGCEVSLIYHDFRHPVLNGLLVEGKRVLVHEARSIDKNRHQIRWPRVWFNVFREPLRRSSFVAFVINVKGYPLRLFLRKSSEFAHELFGNDKKRRSKKFTVRTEPPRSRQHPSKKITLWGYEGAAATSLLVSLRNDEKDPP